MTKHLILRTCNADMRSYNGFQWPRSGPITAPDWNPKEECGGGLHGFLRGEGEGDLADWRSEAVWVVAEVETFVDLGGKVKFPTAEVIFVGSRLNATALVKARYPDAAVIGANVAVENGRVAVVGERGTATAGDWGAATAGSYGTATAGSYGTATAGECGTATAGEHGTATAGNSGMLQIYYYDRKDNRRRLAVAYVGEDGIRPTVKYRLDDSAKFVPA
jgi:hypothetical protein